MIISGKRINGTRCDHIFGAELVDCDIYIGPGKNASLMLESASFRGCRFHGFYTGVWLGMPARIMDVRRAWSAGNGFSVKLEDCDFSNADIDELVVFGGGDCRWGIGHLVTPVDSRTSAVAALGANAAAVWAGEPLAVVTTDLRVVRH